MTSSKVKFGDCRPKPRNVWERFINFHGVTVRFCTSVKSHVIEIDKNYRPFVVKNISSPPHIDCVVSRSQDFEDDNRQHLDGVLADGISFGSDFLQVSGYNVDDPRAFNLEVRSYLTGLILGRLMSDRFVQQFHASAVIGRRGPLVFAGPTRAGKTSMALLALMNGADYIANDITLLEIEPNRHRTVVYGLPQMLTLELEAAGWFATKIKSVRSTIDRVSVPRRNIHYSRMDDKIEIDVRTIEGTHIVSEPSELSIVVFPERVPQLERPRIRRLDRDDAIARLAMLGEGFGKWGFQPALSGSEYIRRLSLVAKRACRNAVCFHLQWSNDHEANLILLRNHVI